jgi:endonuclease/exonuclease/phosphatase (EEP) superfamily protein YafD
VTITSPATRVRPRRPGLAVVRWLPVLAAAGWAVVRFTGRETGPLVQLFAFTPYAAAAAILLAVLVLAARRWLAGAVALVAAALLVTCVLPRALPDPDRGPAAGVAVAALTTNMLEGGADAAAIVRLVRDHDVGLLALQEFTPQARTDLAAAGLDALLPYAALGPEVGTSGSALYSRWPVAGGGTRRNGGGFLQAYGSVQPPGAPRLLVESVHPVAPAGLSALAGWRADLAAEPGAAQDGPPRILLGDFNSTLDHAPLRDLIAHGYRDAADAVGQGLVGTWGPYHGAPIPPVTIDHVLVDRRLGVRAVSVHGVPRSDHRAVLATLVLPRA